ncbi:hypothetical protein CLAIMM_08664 [Cladophialophora immunda]|nr:hypothetical protein CLAIMM_08664 [Cladophialophora immunda]
MDTQISVDLCSNATPTTAEPNLSIDHFFDVTERPRLVEITKDWIPYCRYCGEMKLETRSFPCMEYYDARTSQVGCLETGEAALRVSGGSPVHLPQLSASQAVAVWLR